MIFFLHHWCVVAIIYIYNNDDNKIFHRILIYRILEFLFMNLLIHFSKFFFCWNITLIHIYEPNLFMCFFFFLSQFFLCQFACIIDWMALIPIHCYLVLAAIGFFFFFFFFLVNQHPSSSILNDNNYFHSYFYHVHACMDACVLLII